MKYSEIKTMDELEKAHRRVKARLDREGQNVRDSFYGVRESYSPSNMLLSGLRAASTVFPFDRMLLTAVRRTRRLLLK